MMIGKKQITADVVGVGDIGAVTKLLFTTTNDTLCDKSKAVSMQPIKFPVPCLSMAILAEGQRRRGQDRLRPAQASG